MKTYTLIFILFLPFVLSGQEFMTVGEVFDFEIGDEFQIEVRGNNTFPNADRITIINKYFTVNHDTVFYIRFHDSYFVTVENFVGFYHFWTETDTVSYSNLDLPIFQSEFWSPYEEYMFSYDTISENMEEFCDSLINGYFYCWNEFEPICISVLYARGLGLARFIHSDPSSYYEIDNVLFYYKKNNLSCGIADTITESISSNALLNDIKIFPIPATDFLIIDNRSNLEIGSIFINDLNGYELKQFKPTETHINISDLAPGIYFLRIEYNKGVLVRKIAIY